MQIIKKNKEFLKQVLLLAIPVISERLLTSMVNTIDTMMIGGVGEIAISAVAIVNKLFFIYQLIIFGLSNGVSIYISQYAGAGKKEKITDLFNLGLRLCTIVALITTAIIVLFPDLLLGLFAQNPVVLDLAKSYLYIIIFTMLPFAWSNTISISCRILNAPKLPLYASILSCVVNISLNATLIYGLLGFPELGVIGAAIATVIARLVEFSFLLISAKKCIPEVQVKLKVDLDKEMQLDVIRKAMPLMGNECIWSIGLSLVFINYSFIAEQHIPAITVADNVRNLISVAYNGFSVASGVLIGQALGSGKLEEAKEKANLIIYFSFVPYIFGTIVLYAIHRIAPVWFSLSAESLEMAATLLLIQALVAWTQGYSNTVYFILRSGGDMKSVLVIDGLFTWYGPVLFSFITARLFNLPLVWAYLVTEGTGFMKVVLATYFYKKGNWLKNLTYQKA